MSFIYIINLCARARVLQMELKQKISLVSNKRS